MLGVVLPLCGRPLWVFTLLLVFLSLCHLRAAGLVCVGRKTSALHSCSGCVALWFVSVRLGLLSVVSCCLFLVALFCRDDLLAVRLPLVLHCCIVLFVLGVFSSSAFLPAAVQSLFFLSVCTYYSECRGVRSVVLRCAAGGSRAAFRRRCRLSWLLPIGCRSRSSALCLSGRI